MKTRLDQLYEQEEKLSYKLATLTALSVKDKDILTEERGKIIRDMGQVRDRIEAIIRNGILSV